MEPSENPSFGFPSIGKRILKIRAILNNQTTTDRTETGFSSNNKPEGAENTPILHQSPNYQRFPNIQLQFLPVGPPFSLKMFNIY